MCTKTISELSQDYPDSQLINKANAVINDAFMKMTDPKFIGESLKLFSQIADNFISKNPEIEFESKIPIRIKSRESVENKLRGYLIEKLPVLMYLKTLEPELIGKYLKITNQQNIDFNSLFILIKDRYEEKLRALSEDKKVTKEAFDLNSSIWYLDKLYSDKISTKSEFMNSLNSLLETQNASSNTKKALAKLIAARINNSKTLSNQEKDELIDYIKSIKNPKTGENVDYLNTRTIDDLLKVLKTPNFFNRKSSTNYLDKFLNMDVFLKPTDMLAGTILVKDISPNFKFKFHQKGNKNLEKLNELKIQLNNAKDEDEKRKITFEITSLSDKTVPIIGSTFFAKLKNEENGFLSSINSKILPYTPKIKEKIGYDAYHIKFEELDSLTDMEFQIKTSSMYNLSIDKESSKKTIQKYCYPENYADNVIHSNRPGKSRPTPIIIEKLQKNEFSFSEEDIKNTNATFGRYLPTYMEYDINTNKFEFLSSEKTIKKFYKDSISSPNFPMEKFDQFIRNHPRESHERIIRRFGKYINIENHKKDDIEKI